MPEYRIISCFNRTGTAIGGSCHLISLKQIPCIYLILYIIKTGIVAVGNDTLTPFLKLIEVIYDLRSEK